jgi:hypothetical protein
MAVDTSPRSLEEIVPDRLYSVIDFAHLCPSPKGGTMSASGIIRLCASGTISARYIRNGDTRGYWVIMGSEILRYTKGEQPPVPTVTAKRIDAARRRIDALKCKPRKQTKQAAG